MRSFLDEEAARDRKPANIMLVHDPLTETRDWVKVLDFGVAKLITGSDGVQTRSGMLLGTPEFMSPEQCKSARVVTDKSDVYSLGVMLYQKPFPVEDDQDAFPDPVPRLAGQGHGKGKRKVEAVPRLVRLSAVTSL